MYVRWQSRKRTRSEFGGWRESDTRWSAILVENKRIDGKPVQRHIAYLTGFTESGIKIDTQRCYIWDEVSDQLDRLGNQIAPADRKKIEAAVAKKVPRPRRAQYKAIARRVARNLGWEYLEPKMRAALNDEAEQFQGQDG